MVIHLFKCQSSHHLLHFDNLACFIFAAHTTFGNGRSEHLVGLHHTTVGEATVIFIVLATP